TGRDCRPRAHRRRRNPGSPKRHSNQEGDSRQGGRLLGNARAPHPRVSQRAGFLIEVSQGKRLASPMSVIAEREVPRRVVREQFCPSLLKRSFGIKDLGTFWR